jgi:nondiscriminating aspartyl-tRNA synthetase
MERIRSVHVASHVGQRVRIVGWLHSLRRLGGVSFLGVRDGWGITQAVAGAAQLAPLEGLSLESVLAVEGEVRAAPKAPGGVELGDIAIEVVSPVTEPPPLPLGKKFLDAQLPALLENAVVANRHPTRRAVFRLGAAVMRAFRHALDARGFVEIQSPKLVAAATEGGSNVFAVDYFGRTAYLAQSPQFYKQVMVGVFERVYEIGPVFRAEPHDTRRHLNQYTSLDVELGFIGDHFDVMRVLVEVLRAILDELGAHHAAELQLLGASLPALGATVPQLHFAEAQALLVAALGEHERGQPDLSPEGERWLGQWAQEQHGSDFLFVTGYPLAKRPFYTHPDPERSGYSNSFDLLFRGTELVTGGQRLHRYESYRQALVERGIGAEALASYLQAFKHGMPPHGGFAIGLERFLMQLLGLSNVRLASLFPRDLNRLVP